MSNILIFALVGAILLNLLISIEDNNTHAVLGWLVALLLELSCVL